jgi:HTH-type transcriptional regulator / antitoxin HigA
MEIKPIHNERQHRAALKEIERLWSARQGSPEHDRLEILATLVEDYEQRHQPVYPPDPVEAIRFRMEQLGLDRKALEPSIGSRARVSEVLSGKRSLTLEMIRRLHRQLGIPADVLLAS